MVAWAHLIARPLRLDGSGVCPLDRPEQPRRALASASPPGSDRTQPGGSHWSPRPLAGLLTRCLGFRCSFPSQSSKSPHGTSQLSSASSAVGST